MNRAELERRLNSAGKTVFVEHFAAFCDYAHGGSSVSCLRALQNVGYSEKARNTRCSKAKAIFGAGKEKVALEICRDAKISDATKKRAATILRDID